MPGKSAEETWPESAVADSRKASFFSIDGWAVLIALALALAVKFNLWPSIPW